MSLSERIAAATLCRVQGCDRQRAKDALVCDVDLNELWANRLDRHDDGSFTRRRSFVAVDRTGRIASHAA